MAPSNGLPARTYTRGVADRYQLNLLGRPLQVEYSEAGVSFPDLDLEAEMLAGAVTGEISMEAEVADVLRDHLRSLPAANAAIYLHKLTIACAGCESDQDLIFVPHPVQEAMYCHVGDAQRRRLSGYSHVPELIQVRLARHPDHETRRVLARNRHACDQALALLARDGDAGIAKEAKEQLRIRKIAEPAVENLRRRLAEREAQGL